MIKCGKLEGKEQCILYFSNGRKEHFPYSKHGGEKGAKAAAHKREGQIQFFKKKHQELRDALQAFGAPAVLKYVLDGSADCEGCQEVVKAHVADWLEKARGEGKGAGGSRQGDGGADQCVCPKCGATADHEKGTPCNKTKCPKCGAAMQGQPAEKSEAEAGGEVEKAEKGKGWTPPPKGWTPASLQKYWKAMGGSVTECMERAKGHVTDPAKFCASLKDKVTGTTKWRGKEKKKSFDETVEETLAMLQKDETEQHEVDLEDVNLGELEEWLSQWEQDGETPTAEAETTSEPEPPSPPQPEAEPEPAPQEVAEPEHTFLNFLRREHQERQARMRGMVLAQVEEGHDEHGD